MKKLIITENKMSLYAGILVSLAAILNIYLTIHTFSLQTFLLTLLLLLFAYYFLSHYFFRRLEADKKQLIYRDSFKRTYEYLLEDITSIKVGKHIFNNYLYFYRDHHLLFYIPNTNEHIEELADFLEEQDKFIEEKKKDDYRFKIQESYREENRSIHKAVIKPMSHIKEEIIRMLLYVLVMLGIALFFIRTDISLICLVLVLVITYLIYLVYYPQSNLPLLSKRLIVLMIPNILSALFLSIMTFSIIRESTNFFFHFVVTAIVMMALYYLRSTLKKYKPTRLMSLTTLLLVLIVSFVIIIPSNVIASRSVTSTYSVVTDKKQVGAHTYYVDYRVKTAKKVYREEVSEKEYSNVEVGDVLTTRISTGLFGLKYRYVAFD